MNPGEQIIHIVRELHTNTKNGNPTKYYEHSARFIRMRGSLCEIEFRNGIRKWVKQNSLKAMETEEK